VPEIATAAAPKSRLEDASSLLNGSRRYEPQKKALLDLLKVRFKQVECEVTFPWLVVPGSKDLEEQPRIVLQSLEAMRGFSGFVTAGHSLYCDFLLPSERIIIEYDERQHFTVQRLRSLELYPTDFEMGFDRQEWISACDLIQATDNSPPYRDEQRAFYDFLRDFLAVRHGYQIVRIRHSATDWTSRVAQTALEAVLPDGVRQSNIIEHPRTGVEISRFRRIALISHDYTVIDRRGLYDYTEHFSRINQICDTHGCDTILYALYTWDLQSPTLRTHTAIFDGLANIQRVVLEVGKPPASFDHVEVWDKQRSSPLVATQRFFKSADRDEGKQEFIQGLRSRLVANGLLVLCGETNITSLTRSTGAFRDPFHFVGQLQELDVHVVLNPIHDYMRRYEMREKRKFYSMHGRTVVSVWNKGKRNESELPWTLFHDGEDCTEQIVDIQNSFSERPDIRIGIIDLPNLQSSF